MNYDDLMLEKKYSWLTAYCQSKLANILFTLELARRLEATGVTTYSLHPGVIDTGLARDIWWRNLPVVKQIMQGVLYLFRKDMVHGAQTTICCAVDEKLANESGKHYIDCKDASLYPILPHLVHTEDAKDIKSAQKLWDISAQLVKLPKQSGTQT